MTTELRKSSEISPHQHRHIGEVQLQAPDGSFACVLADGRRAFVSAREIKGKLLHVRCRRQDHS